MKRTADIAALSFLLCLGIASAAGATELQGIKLGGGVLWNDDVGATMHRAGGSFHASVDVSAFGNFAFTPFYEISRRNSTNTTLAGAEIHYDVPLNDNGAAFYLGPGAGIVHGSGKTKFHANAVAGVKYPLTKAVGVFAQSKYIWAAGGTVNGLSGYTGLTFSIPY